MPMMMTENATTNFRRVFITPTHPLQQSQILLCDVYIRYIRQVSPKVTGGATDASSIGWGGVVNASSGPFRAGGVFTQHWVSKHINIKEMYALYHVLRQFCTRYPDGLRRAQVFVHVDNQSVVGGFTRGRATDPATHALLVQLFELQVEHGFMLTLKWIPTASNSVADAISRPSRDSIIRLRPSAF